MNQLRGPQRDLVGYARKVESTDVVCEAVTT